jgi:hypothetical protein
MLWLKCDARELRAALGKFKPRLLPDQLPLFVALYELLKRGTSLEMNDIAPVVHRIIFSMSTSSLDPRVKVDSAVEQSIVLTMTTTIPGLWLSSPALTQLFARWQRVIFSTLFHNGWLGGTERDFALDHHVDTSAEEIVDSEVDEDSDEEDNIEDSDEEDNIEERNDFELETQDVEEDLRLYDFKKRMDVGPCARGWTLADFAKEVEVRGSNTVDDLVDNIGMEILDPEDRGGTLMQ